MEVVITKANISRSLYLQLPSTSQLFLSPFAALSSDLPAFFANDDTAEGMPLLMAAPVWPTVHVLTLYYKIIWYPADI